MKAAELRRKQWGDMVRGGEQSIRDKEMMLSSGISCTCQVVLPQDRKERNSIVITSHRPIWRSKNILNV